jgi:hypothetical protein
MYRPISEEEQQMMSYHFQKPRPQDLPDLPEDNPLAREWKAYKREIIRLLGEGHVGRHALIKGDTVLSIWDTSYDAYQAGRIQFGLDTFMVQEIEPIITPVRYGYSRLCQP